MMDYKDWEQSWKKEQYVPEFIKELSEGEAAYALREAWSKIYGAYPSDESLALLWSQSCLETGRWKIIRNNNFGNIKKKHYQKLSWKVIPDDGHNWTMFATGENLWNKTLNKNEWHWFEPPHYQTHFRSYKDIVQGAEDYIKFICQNKRYEKSWQEVINGNPQAFSHELYVAGYYTASEQKYTAGIVRLFNEFMSKKDTLLAWAPKKEVQIIEVIEDDEVSEVSAVSEVSEVSEGLDPIIPELTTSIKVVEAKPVVYEEKNNGKSTLFLFIAGAFIALYSWISNLF